MSLILVGLGVKEGDISVSALEALREAEIIYASDEASKAFKERKDLKGFAALPLESITFAEDLTPKNGVTYESILKGDGFAEKLLQAAKDKKVVYCARGSVAEDRNCAEISAQAQNMKEYVYVCEGVSALSYAKDFTGLMGCGAAVYPAGMADLLKSADNAILYSIMDEDEAEAAVNAIVKLFGEEATCFYIKGGNTKRISVNEILGQEFGADCAVVVCEPPFLKKYRYDYADLCSLVRLLRREGGCPWDRAQTPQSIKGNVVEEAYELEDAIERGDVEGIKEEIGDILLQAAFQSVLKEEEGAFTAEDAITANVKKLISRHSHIFGDDKAKSESEALGVWDKNKYKEKHMTTFSDTVEAVPKNMPACMRAQKVGKRAGKSGLDFSSPVSASDKMWEEVKKPPRLRRRATSFSPP